MSVWEKYQASLRENQQKDQRRTEVPTQPFDPAVEAQRKAEAEKGARIEAGMKLHRNCGTSGLLDEIKSHIPGARTEMITQKDGTVKARINWETPTEIKHLATGQTTIEKRTYGLEVSYSGPAARYPEGYLDVDTRNIPSFGSQQGGRRGLKSAFGHDRESLENALASQLREEIENSKETLYDTSGLPEPYGDIGGPTPPFGGPY